MPDPIETPEPATEPEITPPAPTADTTEVEKWKALSRKNEQRAKENEAAAKRLAELEEANKTELERATARAEAAEKVIAERDAQEATTALIAEVAAANGVPATALRGTTRDELEAHAATLKALIVPTPTAPSSDGLGNVGDPIGGTKQITSQNDLKSMSPEQINEARRSGQLKDLLAGKTT